MTDIAVNKLQYIRDASRTDYWVIYIMHTLLRWDNELT